MTMTKQEARNWFEDNKDMLLGFEKDMIQKIEEYTFVEYDNELTDSKAQLQLHYAQDGFMFHSQIAIHPDLKGDENVLYRIIAIAHEFGHYKDIKDNHENNVLKYEETPELDQEENAWILGKLFLDEMEWGNFGRPAWNAFLVILRSALGSYYYHYLGDVEKSKAFAVEFAATAFEDLAEEVTVHA